MQRLRDPGRRGERVMKPDRLACGGAVHPAPQRRRHPPLWWTFVEPALTALAVAVAGGLIGFGLFVAAQ